MNSQYKIIKDLSKYPISHYFKMARNSHLYMEKELIRLSEQKNKPTFKSLIVPWSALFGEVNYYMNLLNFLKTSGLLRKYEKQFIDIITFSFEQDSKIFTNQKIFEKLKMVKNSQLSENEKKIVLDIYDEFIESGIDLSDKKQKILLDLDIQINTLSARIDSNIQEDTDSIKLILNKEQYSIMSNEWIKNAKILGKGVVVLSPYNMEDFFEKSSDSRLKKKYSAMNIKRNTKKTYDNRKNVEDIINAYNKKASLLGYKKHQDYVLKDHAFKINDVQKILKILLDKTRKYAIKEKEFLYSETKKHGIKNPDKSDFDYIIANMDLKSCNKKVSLVDAINSINNMLYRMFKITLKKSSNKSFANKILVYDLFKSSKIIGQIHFDCRRRIGKMEGAQMTTLNPPSKQSPFGQVAILTSFQGKMTSFEYKNLAHEVGHAIHCLLSDTKYRFDAGLNVAKDLLEFPSTLVEKLAVNPEFIQTSMNEKDSHSFLKFTNFRANIMNSLIDLEIYSHKKITIDKIKKIENRIFKTHGMYYTKEVFETPSNTHIVGGGYESSYYVYVIAEILACMVYKNFDKSPEKWGKPASKFYKGFLSKGTSINKNKLLANIIDGKMDYDAVIEYLLENN